MICSDKGSPSISGGSYSSNSSSGIDYARKFREQELSHDIVLVTGYQDTITSEDSQELRKLGVPTLDKPIKLETLFAKKLSAWRSVTPQDLAQRSLPNVISATAATSDEAVAAVTQAITRADLTEIHQKVSDLSAKVERMQGWVEGRGQGEVVNLGRKQIKAGRIGWIVGTLGVLVVLAFGLPSVIRSCGGPAPSKHLVIAEGTQPVAAPVYVANEKHFWKDIGLNVELVSFTSGRLCLDAILGARQEQRKSSGFG